MRVQKYLALCGVASRRRAEDMIAPDGLARGRWRGLSPQELMALRQAAGLED